MLKRILIIDDEELIIRSLRKLLELKGFEVFTAKKGEDAVAIVEDETFDLIISDIRMPGMNGVETVKAIYCNLSRDGKQKPPVIFVTGYTDTEVTEKAGALHPLAYIHKPFEITEIAGKIQEALK